jgi:hypothetical protein
MADLLFALPFECPLLRSRFLLIERLRSRSEKHRVHENGYQQKKRTLLSRWKSHIRVFKKTAIR